MWISRKTSEIEDDRSLGGQVGVVSVSGRTPAVVTDGEARSAELAITGGGVYIPKVGDQVFLDRTADGETVVLGRIAGDLPTSVSEGDVYISASAGGGIHIKSSGEIVISGKLALKGTTSIDGVLTINGMPYVPMSGG